MKAAPSPDQLQNLRSLIADTIAGHKAYDVPGVCNRLGLAAGTSEEAFNSKFKYASRRLAEIPAKRLTEIGRELLEETRDYGLSEAIAAIEELGSPPITELTRKRLVAVFGSGTLATEMSDYDLVSRLWPIDKMESIFGDSHDPWFPPPTLADDIQRHRVASQSWKLPDFLAALGFFNCSRAQVARFLNLVVHPLSQTSARQKQLVDEFNIHLRHDDYHLAEAGRMSGSLVYEVRPLPAGAPADESISAVLAAFNPDIIHSRWQMAMDRRTSDPAGAITLARTLLEDVCKWILHEAGETYDETAELPVLYRLLSKRLKLAPDDHSEEVFKKILGSCQNIVESIGALRNKLSDAHSPGPKRARPLPRHAELAVNLSGTMATFLVSTWQARQKGAGVIPEPAS
ncbi:MAG: hypothetical protein E5X53_18835 [Mesorhizobium sp.]|uniref:abortive infection family protein n=1 Tax=Mesorhizobium sp. TaxID=1871066 RepID=UPI0011FB80C0|nr:abortive infection family protein [Mesorhizobium sp.]TIR50592.1 MAG: hypothetical protein E5X53_18835 [Mesorhizobium sp.]